MEIQIVFQPTDKLPSEMPTLTTKNRATVFLFLRIWNRTRSVLYVVRELLADAGNSCRGGCVREGLQGEPWGVADSP